MILTKLNTGVVLCDEIFSKEELDQIEVICKQHLDTLGEPLYSPSDHAKRNSDALFLPRDKNTTFFYKRMSSVAKEINEQFFQFDLTGYGDGILALDYNQIGDHFDWHIDNVESYTTLKGPVKLIIAIQLSDPSEYEGCTAEIVTSGITHIPKKRGIAFAVAGYTAHRVTPLVVGHRLVISCWFTGPQFK